MSVSVKKREEQTNITESFLYLVRILETFISESDGDGEDGVGGVLVKASFAVSSKQSQSPAPTQTHKIIRDSE